LKIKVWALVLIIVGSLFIGAGGMFAAMSGVSLVGHLIQDVQMLRPSVNIKAPASGSGGYYGIFGNGGNGGNGGNSGNSGTQPGQGNYYYGQPGAAPALPAGLPANFNAGVNIESTYAAMTNRSVEQVQAAELTAQTDAWGLANQEGKLNDLKAKVTEAVTASLKQMVTDGKITQAQSDSYLKWVNQYLRTVGQATYGSMMPGNGRGRQVLPNASTDPSNFS
jgi:hypothetical protein